MRGSEERLGAGGTRGSHTGQQQGAAAAWAELLRIRSEYYFECIAGREDRQSALALQLQKAQAAAEAVQRAEDDAAAAKQAKSLQIEKDRVDAVEAAGRVREAKRKRFGTGEMHPWEMVYIDETTRVAVFVALSAIIFSLLVWMGSQGASNGYG